MDHGAAVFHRLPISHRHDPDMAACRTWPRCPSLASSLLLGGLDRFGLSPPLASALACRTPLCRAHGRARTADGHGGSAFSDRTARRRDVMGATTSLARNC